MPALQANGFTENTKNSVATTTPNFPQPHLEKSHVPEGERPSKLRFDHLGSNINEKSRSEINCQSLDMRLDNNTLIENERLESNTHPLMVGNFDKRLDSDLNLFEKGKMEGLHVEKNIHEIPRLESVHVEKTRVDGVAVHMLENAHMASHLDKRTLDPTLNKIDKCVQNSVQPPISLGKRKDSSTLGVLDKGRMDGDVSLAHAPVSSPTHGPAVPNPGLPPSNVHSPALPNNPPHQQAVHPGSSPVPLKPVLSSHIYQNSMRTHLGNSGLSSHNGTSLQYPQKKLLALHNPNSQPSSRSPSTPLSIVSTTTSVTPVISNSNPISFGLPMSHSGMSNISTTLSLSNPGLGSSIVPVTPTHTTLHSISHLSNQSRTKNETILPRSENSPQPVGGSIRTSSDLIQSASRVNTPPGQNQNMHQIHSTSHVGFQSTQERINSSEIVSSTSSTCSTVTSNVTASPASHSEVLVASTISSHPPVSLNTSTSSGVGLISHGGTTAPGSPSVHSGYSLPMSASPYPYSSLYGSYSSNLQHQYLPPRVEPSVSVSFYYF